jgi:hypothetical protein
MGVAEEHPTGGDWLAIISRPTLAEFAGAFAEGAVLEASVLAAPIVGAPGIRAFFEATRAMYDRIQFTSEHRVAKQTWLKWQGEYLGLPVAGVTVLVTGTEGAIAGVRIFHTPLKQLIAFAADVKHRLDAAIQGDIPCE